MGRHQGEESTELRGPAGGPAGRHSWGGTDWRGPNSPTDLLSQWTQCRGLAVLRPFCIGVESEMAEIDRISTVVSV